MKKAILMDLSNDEVAKDYLRRSLCGEKSFQRILFDSLVGACKNVQYHFYYQAKKAGLNLRDLDEEYIYCFMQLLERYDETRGTVLSFYKYLYFNRLRTIIKKETGLTRVSEVRAIGKEEDYFENDTYLNNMDDVNKTQIGESELSNIILGEKSNIVNNKEKMVYHYYLKSYSFKEISRDCNLKYRDCIKYFNSGKKKIKNYLKQNNIEIGDSN